jgi:hypothetical protein
MYQHTQSGSTMRSIRTIASQAFALAIAGSLALGCVQTVAAAEPQAPDQVHTALRILASVYADMESKLPNQQYDRLPHENQEFQDGSGAMRDAMAKEPADYRNNVLAALDKVVKASQNVADISKSHDAAKVRSALDALAASMHSLNGLFPQALRSEPGSVPAPQHNGPAPNP